MALSSTFEERLRGMEHAFKERLSLLQAEADLQYRKSLLHSAGLASLRRAQQRCHLLLHRHAKLSALVLARKSEIESSDKRYGELADELRSVDSVLLLPPAYMYIEDPSFRAARREIGDIEERKMENDAFFESKRREMKSFKEDLNRSVEDSRSEVRRLRGRALELQGTVEELQARDGCMDNSEIVEAERRKADLVEEKERLDATLASNHQLWSLLQKQLNKVLVGSNRS